MRSGHPRFYELLAHEAQLHDTKNADYTGTRGPLDNLMQCEKFGIPAHIGVLVRLTDKYSREETLAFADPLIKSESFEDVQMDKSVYSKIEVILYEEFKKMPVEWQQVILENLKENAVILGKWKHEQHSKPNEETEPDYSA